MRKSKEALYRNKTSMYTLTIKQRLLYIHHSQVPDNLLYGITVECVSCTHFGFMSGSVKVKLLIIGGVEGSSGLSRWLLGEFSTLRGRLLDLDVVDGLSGSSAEPVMTRLDGSVEVTGSVMARSE